MKKCVEESRMYLLLQAAKPVIVRSEDVENSVTVGIVLIPVVNALIYRTVLKKQRNWQPLEGNHS